MKLIDVYTAVDPHRILFEFLEERGPGESISHRIMPTYERHCEFVYSRPYAAWYLAADEISIVGHCYITHQREVGIQIWRNERGHGHGEAAVTELMRLHPGRFLANINPANEASIALFRKIGFGGPIQITLEKP